MQEIFPNGSSIEAEKISIGKDFQIGSNVRIKVRGSFTIGKCGRFGDNVVINGEIVIIGDHFFHYTAGLNVGGGGSQFSTALFRVGDRCVLHNNNINIARPVVLCNDVGYSLGVDIITHGFWQSPLEGYPVKYNHIILEDGVIVGQRSIVMGSVVKNIVVGAGSVITEDLRVEKSVYAGNPAKFIKRIITPPLEVKKSKITDILEVYHLSGGTKLQLDYPFIRL